MSDLVLTPHRTGPWLLRASGRLFVIPAELGRRIGAGDSRVEWSAAASRLTGTEAAALSQLLGGGGGGRARRARSRAIWPRLPLVPAGIVRRLARAASPWARPRILLLQAALGTAGYAAGWSAVPAAPPAPHVPPWTPLLALGLYLAVGLWHEIGHAAALTRHGYPPGRIGCGLLLVLPVLYCDVTAAVALPRRGRLEVDAAGAAFQIAPSGLLFAAGRFAGTPAAAWAGIAGLASVAWSLLPFLRSDGYWFLCDLLGRVDLESPSRAGGTAPRRAAAVLVAYRIAHLLFLAAVTAGAAWRLAALAPWLAGRGGSPLRWLAVPPAAGLAVLLALRLRGIVPRHLAGLRGDAAILLGRPPPATP